MIAGLNPEQVTFMVILIVATGLLVTERLRNDVVAMLIVIALAATGLLKTDEALQGFSSEAAIVVAAIFVMSAAMHLTGVSETLGRWIGRLAGSNYTRIIGVVMPSVALLSAFTHHVTTTAIMLPVMVNLSKEHDIPASKLLMPLSFAASLGTTITIIGAPAFLIASSLLQQAGRPGLGVFSIAPVGLAISAAGTLFTLLVARFLLPSRKGAEDPAGRFRLDNYFTELTVLPDSPYLGKTIGEVENGGPHQIEVVGMVRAGERIASPPDEHHVEEGDVLLVRTSPEEILAIRQEPGVELEPAARYEKEAEVDAKNGDEDISEELVQAVVAPGSDLAGKSISQVDFRRRFGAVVLSIWRQDGWIQEELSEVRLMGGDVLVLQGDEEALARVSGDRAFLMMTPFQGEALLRRKAPLAAGIMAGTVLLAAFGVLDLPAAVLVGAVAMVLTRCVNPRQAYQAIDARVFVFIAGAIPLGAAMEKSGTSKVVAGWLQQALGGLSEFWILIVIFAVVSVLTQFMSDSATVALFAPVAIALAGALGHKPEAYVVTVAMASVAAFLTPIGHHGNLLIYGPGGYQFSDFVKVGVPLTILTGLVAVSVAMLVWPG